MADKNWYVPSVPEYIGRHKAIKHHLSKETCLSGKHGEIFVSGHKKLKCCLYVTQVARLNGFRGLSKGEEVMFEFDEKDLEKWVKVIKLTKTMPAQVRYASKR